MLLTIITFIIVLSVLVFAHELGHFMMARKFGVKAEEFGLGFPPRACGFYKNNQGKWKHIFGKKDVTDCQSTIYSINWLPLGGFVKIKGENGALADSEREEDQDSFAGKKIWQRAFMLSAGVAMNIILAAVLITVGFMIGFPQALGEQLNARAHISDKKIQIVQVMENTPAASAGLQAGDAIISIDNNSFLNYQELQNYVASNIGNKLAYKIKRDQDLIEANIIPELMPKTNKAGVGIAITETGIVSYPWYLAGIEGVKTTFILIWAIIAAFYELIKGLILGHGITADLTGPVGIATLTGQVAHMGFVYLLQFTALLSINLAVINFFPFPALDGGRMLFLIIEKIKRSPVKKEVEATIHNIGFALLMVLVVFVTFRDVARFGNVFKNIWEKIA
ncbi:RIP metalloprotease RseP, partial [Patescibacteria group bacterium]|nr:RIP metalloprotease RseP [Patescibacteria group bacterium]